MLTFYRYDTGTISGILAMPYWQRQFSTGFHDSKGHLNITASQQSEVVSILSAGTFFGALGAAPVADRIGRRFALIASCWVFIFGVILQTAATHLPMFVAGRFFAGFGVGLVSALSKYFVFQHNLVMANGLISPTLPIRDCTKMDSGRHCWIIPIGHHHRSLAGCYCEQLFTGSQW